MNQEIYWYLAISLSIFALVISGVSLYLTLRGDKRDQSYKLLSLKTEVFVVIHELHQRISELQLLISRQLALFQETPELRNFEYEAHIQLRNINNEIQQHIEHVSEYREKISELHPTDYAAWEDFNATYTAWNSTIKKSVEQHKEAYEKLKEYSETMANKAI